MKENQNLMNDSGRPKSVLCDNLEGWEVQDRGDIYNYG